MHPRSLRLAAASAFVAGLGLFVVGAIVAVTISWPTGVSLLMPLGACLMAAGRLVARRYKLPAP